VELWHLDEEEVWVLFGDFMMLSPYFLQLLKLILVVKFWNHQQLRLMQFAPFAKTTIHQEIFQETLVQMHQVAGDY
jgi:hypothetical protein